VSFNLNQRFTVEYSDTLLVEAGTASGRQPVAIVDLRSYLGEFLQETGVSLAADDEGSFRLPLLHFRRTFVEKMFAIHSKVQLLKRDGQPLGTYARHYYDLFQLAAQAEVVAMLKSAEYPSIKADYDQISLANSDALFPPLELAASIKTEYDRQCKMLCYGPYPSWEEIQARLQGLRNIL
jgi:hypothetical protein